MSMSNRLILWIVFEHKQPKPASVLLYRCHLMRLTISVVDDYEVLAAGMEYVEGNKVCLMF